MFYISWVGLLRHRELEYHGGPQVVREYSLEEVTAMTNNFEKLLGKGGFGLVHYGRQPNGLEVAVKRLSSTSHQGAVEFFNEVQCSSPKAFDISKLFQAAIQYNIVEQLILLIL